MRSPADILSRAARAYGRATALITPGRTLAYSELDDLSDRAARWFADHGVGPGTTVSLYSKNRWEWIVTYHAALKAGAVINPVNVMLTPEELAFVLTDCSASVVVVGEDHAVPVRELARGLPRPVEVVSFGGEAPDGVTPFGELLRVPGHRLGAGAAPAPKDPCTISYTSGTTGHPKGAVQSHQAVLLNVALTAAMHGRTSHDVVVTALPAPHVYGNVVINSTFVSGGVVVLMERFDPGQALRLIEEHRATMFEGVPAMYAMMLADPQLAKTDLTSLERCTVGGQTMPVATIERWESVSGARLIELWGMTELSGLGLTHALHAPPCPGSAGVSLPGVEVRVADLDDAKSDAAPGRPGELMIRGPIVMLGYHGDPAATAEAVEPDGWLHTGDIATRAEDGHVFIVDRRKDMIITGGYNVYPAELERVLSEHPDVAVVAVGPVPDEVKGELACAYVVPRAGGAVTAEELMAYAGERLAAYKRPRIIRFVDTLPVTSSGKIMRRELIKRFPPEDR
ncbi:class I adenylate-forming enzyme family protein [Streptomyces ipomoeae]|uniref:class I adenylate-forming enzyme family protein n=1 Tax=Streptomyces ipomoeae TaxID=103232 RepID=UPI0011462D1B|nr:AMP-binding protein [Streptomyces ipomoeae]MDX2937736.1 AMP-binding protein [Streptomyces ipomoeae]TQE17256.1 fatty-acid--CoA ligase [Streptomyces ipomoeae]